MAELLAAAPPKVLTDLILEFAAEWPDVRRECFDYLKTHVVELNRRVFGEAFARKQGFMTSTILTQGGFAGLPS